MAPNPLTRSSTTSTQRHNSAQSRSHPNLSRTSSSNTTTATKAQTPYLPAPPGANMPSLLATRTPSQLDGSRIAAMRTPAVRQENSTPKTPSPNYFGLAVEPSDDSRSAIGPKANWSPPTSSIRSFGPQSPQHLPVDANPMFDAFKKATQQAPNFSLGHGNLQHFAGTPGLGTSRFERKPPSSEADGFFGSQPTENKTSLSGKYDKSDDTQSPRPVQPSVSTPSFFDIQRFDSPSMMSRANVTPASTTSFKPTMPPRTASKHGSFRIDGMSPRLSLPHNNVEAVAIPRILTGTNLKRGETLPATLEDGPTFLTPERYKILLDSPDKTSFLLLDLRVAPQYALYRIKDALNLCIPTTLLKRPSFNIEKLADTFKNENEKARFAKWKSCKYIVVYDAKSTEKKDALSAINTLKKFANEGWTGDSFIIKGGMEGMVKAYPDLIDKRSSREMHPNADEALPVAGGCVMPENKNNGANPFFNNIRQNETLQGGVGQINLKLPKGQTNATNSMFPKWLSTAADPQNHGKAVADKFLHIEQTELARMQAALSSDVLYGDKAEVTKDKPAKVSIAGFEKGSKNRYNNIWPFEHSRVVLEGRNGACDYVNASHLKTSLSNKRYIASQAPLPATYEDFWTAIWQEDVRTIVMLTAEHEGGQLKCHPYWHGKQFGQFHLKSLSERKVSLEPNKHRRSSTRKLSGGAMPVVAMEATASGSSRARAATTTDSPLFSPSKTESGKEPPYAVVRKFTLSHAAEPFKPMREITQIHYSGWPDFGAPEEPAHILSLVELSNAMQRSALSPRVSHRPEEPETAEDSRPMLVHCSAGCGRTGTFCTIDTVVDMLKRQGMEADNGTTPMEGTESAISGHMSKKDRNDAAWLFNSDMDLVERTVVEFRTQRISVVQTLIQFVLCYEVVLEWIEQQKSKTSPSN